MYTFPPDGERKEEGHIYSRKSVCFYEKQTPLQYLHPLVILVLSNLCPVCNKTVCVGAVCRERLPLERKEKNPYSSFLFGREQKKSLLLF